MLKISDLQIVAKYYAFLRHGNDIKDCVTFLEDKIYLRYKNEGVINGKLGKIIKYTDLMFNFGALSYFCSYSALMINPIIIYKLSGRIDLITPCLLPGVDSTTVYGYIITTIFLFVCSSIAYVIMVCSDFGIMALLINSMALIEVFDMKFNEINDMMMKRNGCNVYSTQEQDIKYAFRNLILMHLDIRKYLMKLINCFHILINFHFRFYYIVINKILEIPNAFNFPFTSLTLVVCIYLIFVVSKMMLIIKLIILINFYFL